MCVCERVYVGTVRLHSCMNIESDAHGVHQCLLHSRRYSTCTARSRPASPNRTHSSGSVASSEYSCSLYIQQEAAIVVSKSGLLMMDFDARNADTKARFCFEALAKIVVNNNNNNNVHLSCAH